MGLLERVGLRRVRVDRPTGDGVTIHVIEDTHTFDSDDGRRIWCGGYAPTDKDGFFLPESEHRTTDRHAFYCHVAGVSFRASALKDKRFAHSSPIKLIAEPDNPHDPNAVGVWDARGDIQLGYIPATLSAEVARLMRGGTTLVGQVIREFRLGSARGKRLGIHIIVFPAGAIKYVVTDDD